MLLISMRIQGADALWSAVKQGWTLRKRKTCVQQASALADPHTSDKSDPGEMRRWVHAMSKPGCPFSELRLHARVCSWCI